MARKGYYGEHAVKQYLSDKYGKQNVIKCAVWQTIDFIVLMPGTDRIQMLVEVKSIHSEKYYMSANRDQWERAIALAKEHNIPLFLFVWKPRESMKIERIA